MGRGEEDYARQHRSRIDEFSFRVLQLYLRAAKEAVSLGYAHKSKYKKEKAFSFSNYPGLREKINKLLVKLARDVVAVINSGTQAEWLLANQKNDDLVKRLFTESMPVELSRRFLGRNLQALEAFQNRKIEGLSLSEKVWKYTGSFKSEMEMTIDMGLLEGRSANQLSQDIRKYLEEPDRLFRRVRDARGHLHLSQAAENYHPGQGRYRSSYKNSLRLARTEINDAYRESDHQRWQQLDFVVGIEVRRSNNPYPCPVCDALKGRYPKNYKFRSVHPNCRCHAVTILATKEEIERLTEMILNDDDTSTFSSVNEVTSMPPGWVEWMAQNRKRLLSAASVPYFVKDNFKDGDIRKGLKFEVEAVKKLPILHKGKITREISGEFELDQLVGTYAARYKSDFARGYKHTRKVQGEEYYMGAYPDGRFVINDAEIAGFNAYRELMTALNKIRDGKKLKFLEEYAIESLYHEILHQKAKGRETLKPHFRGDYKRTAMEIANQFVARHDYPKFIERLGGQAMNQERILKEGRGYYIWVRRFRRVIEVSGANEKTVANKIRPFLLNGPYSELDSRLSDIVRNIGKVDLSDREILFALENGGMRYRRLLKAIRQNRGSR